MNYHCEGAARGNFPRRASEVALSIHLPAMAERAWLDVEQN